MARFTRLQVLSWCARHGHKRASALSEIIKARYGFRVRQTGIVFVTDDSPDVKRWRELGSQ